MSLAFNQWNNTGVASLRLKFDFKTNCVVFILSGMLAIGPLLAKTVSNEQEDPLHELSIKELMSIPISKRQLVPNIHQSDTNKVGPDTINFAIMVPISTYPVYSAELVMASDLAVKFINGHGGINGKRLVMLRGDDHENTPVSAQLAKELVEDYRVEAILGPATSDSVADVLQKVTIPKGIPLISQSASSTKLTEIGGKHAFWRMVANNQQQVDLMAKFIHETMGHRRVFVFGGREMYSEEIRQGIIKYFNHLQNGWADYLAISSLVYIDAMNLEEEIKSAQQQGVTALVITSVNAQTPGLLRQITNYWKGKLPLIVVGDSVTPKYVKEAGVGKILDCIYTYVGAPSDVAPALNHQITQNLDIDSARFDAAYVYDATIILAMAKVLEQQFDLSMKQAVNLIAGDGHKIQYTDYPNIVELYKKHGSFSYYGYSGRVHFSEQGDNLTGFTRIYSIGDSNNQQHCMVNLKN